MNMKQPAHLLLFCFLASLVLLACKEDKKEPATPEPPTLSEQLLGQWKSTQVKVEINSFGGTEQDTTFSADENSMGTVMGFDANFTTFNADGTYADTYQFPGDSLSEGLGNYTLKNDSLTLAQHSPDSLLNHYQIKIEGDILFIQGMVDIDGDGELDDFVSGQSRRTNPTP